MSDFVSANFSARINAPRAVVWNVLTEDAFFRTWTGALVKGSHFVGDWTENSEMRFLTPKGEGFISTVTANNPLEKLHITHTGTVRGGKENRKADNKWRGARENYSLAEEGGVTVLNVEVDTPSRFFYWFFKLVWPVMLDKIKDLAELEVSPKTAKEPQQNKKPDVVPAAKGRVISLWEYVEWLLIAGFLAFMSVGGWIVFDAMEKLAGNPGRGAMLVFLLIFLFFSAVSALPRHVLRKRMSTDDYSAWQKRNNNVGALFFAGVIAFLLFHTWSTDLFFVPLMMLLAVVLFIVVYIAAAIFLHKRLAADSYAKWMRRVGMLPYAVLAVLATLTFVGVFDTTRT